MEARKRLYSAITLGSILIMAFVLVQPTMQQANAVGAEGLPGYDDCDERMINGSDFHDDPITMNTIRSGNIVKTIHAEKEVYTCFLDQGSLEVIVDLTTYIEVYENINSQEVIETNAFSITCLKDEATGTLIDCESNNNISSSPIPVASCEEQPDEEDAGFTHPQEMNTVIKGKIAKTIEAQKEVFECDFGVDDGDFEKKVDIILFTEIYEDLSTQTIIDVQFLSARCVVLRTDSTLVADGGLRDASLESCTFTPIEN